MATSEMDYMGGTPYAVIKIDFSIPSGVSDKPICNLTDTSSGILTFSFTGGYSSTWSVDGQTVTKISGNTSIVAFYVTNGILYAANSPTSTYTATYSGEIENVIIRVEGEPDYNLMNGVEITQATGTYTCSNDGYLNIYIYNNKEATVRIYGKNALVSTLFNVKNVTGTGNTYVLPVKKGFGISVTSTTSDATVTYYSLG